MAREDESHMTTRIRIDLSQGMIEAEGTEEFVRSIYSDFQSRLATSPPTPEEGGQRRKPGRTTPPETEQGAKKAPRRSGASGTYVPKIVKDLDLSGKGKKMSLRDFYNQYDPTTNYERNIIFMYYLTQTLELEAVSVDHVFTCYRGISSIKAPDDLYSSLRDTQRHKGWVSLDSADKVQVTIPGINYLEHDLTKKKADEGTA
jgi:hypothetical protein